jgi:phosphoglycolate phosphatase-like HAD superfamily hydrolase
VLALDFDGVVWDSVNESFEQAWRAWQQVFGPLAEADKDSMRQKFRAARWQAKDGHDFFVTMMLLSREPGIDVGAMSAAEFRARRDATQGEAQAEEFVKAFYASREQMRLHDFEAWMALQRPYPGIVEALGQLRAQVLGMAVATTKDAASAEALLNAAGIHGLQIFGREVSLDKRDHMRAIAAQFGVDMHHVTFVDDLLENLQPLRPLGVVVALAGWGYNTPAEQQRARDEGVPVLDLERFAAEVARLG